MRSWTMVSGRPKTRRMRSLPRGSAFGSFTVFVALTTAVAAALGGSKSDGAIAATGARQPGTIAFVSSYRVDPYADVTFEASLGAGLRRIAARDVVDSPDGRHRARVVRTAGGYGLEVGRRHAGARRVVTWGIGRSGRVLLAWSPDSRRLAAIGASSGTSDISGTVTLDAPGFVWVVTTSGKAPRRLGRGWRVAWSPDGTRLAVERSRATDLRTSDGTLVRSLPNASGVVWSSDGRRIAYVVRRSTFVLADERGRTIRTLTGPTGDTTTTLQWSPTGRGLLATFSGSSGIGRELIEADGAKRTPFYGTPLGWRGSSPRAAVPSIERALTEESDGLDAHLSPDTRYVLLAGNRTGTGVYDVQSGRRLAGSPVVGRHDLIQWSPDSRRILVGEGRLLEAIPVPEMNTRRIATLPPESDLVSARWLTNDTVALRVTRQTFPRLHLLDMQTLTSTEVPATDLATQPFYEDPWWSPDGAILAARRATARGTGDASIVVIEGSTERRIGGGVAARGRPTWSPDGRAVALVAENEDEDDGGDAVVLARSILDGSDRELARIKGALDVAWSPDGDRIAVATDRGVVIVPLARPTETTFVAPPLSAPARRPEVATPTWSPDGRRVAYTGPQGLVVADSDGLADPVVLVRPAARPSGPTWSHDGEWIVFAANDPACPDRLRLMIVPSGGGIATHLFRTPGCAGSRGPAWRPR